MEPSARQVIKISNESKILPNLPHLQILLDPEIKDKQVCVVSITGNFRKGQSFLLNFLVRYLSLKYKIKKPISSKWLDSRDGKVSGFPWKCGSDRHTVGILMWSEIFTAELPSGEEIAIILLDTQGTFDNVTAKQQCAGIFAISTLISSAQIYNLKDKINQFDLEHLECFSGYGQLIQKEDPNFTGAPFQNLCFLIRDWQYKSQISYGSAGGQEFLTKVFSEEDQPQEIQKQNKNVRSLFEKITCFLLPHPGEKVATQPSFDGDFKDINPDFLQYVEEFVPNILSPENLVPKRINGKTIKVSDLYYFIQEYCNYFMERDVPELKTMLQVTAEADFKIASEESLRIYHKAMKKLSNLGDVSVDDSTLETIHLEAKAKATENFDKRNVFGGRNLKMSYKRKLNYFLDEQFLEYKKVNAAHQRKELELTRQKQRHNYLREKQQEQLQEQCNLEYSKQKAIIGSMKQELHRYQNDEEKESAIPPHLRQRIAELQKPLPPQKKMSFFEQLYNNLFSPRPVRNYGPAASNFYSSDYRHSTSSQNADYPKPSNNFLPASNSYPSTSYQNNNYDNDHC